jgi:plasmid stabilization system protein ParE
VSYEVVVTRRAERELNEAADWWAAHRSREQAERWYNGFVEGIISLEDNPERCPLSRENDVFPYEIRDLLYGLSRRRTHRAVFTVRPAQVAVLTIRHVSQRDLTVSDL